MNAQKELLEHIEDREVKHVHIVYENSYGGESCENEIVISGSLEDVIERLNFDYDSGFGIQEVSGYIWYEDGTWSDRGEYDGSEWWQHQKWPEIPNEQVERPQKASKGETKHIESKGDRQ